MPHDPIELLRSVLPDGYVVERPVGRGGQGSVFLGTLNGQRVALKVFNPEHDPRRLRRELETLRHVECPHVVKVIGAEQISMGGASYPLVAYEYLPGSDLASAVEPDAGRLSLDSLTQIGVQIGTAIESLWKRRIVHRDVKPANIMGVAHDRYVLVDVGFARYLDLASVTPAGAVPGTPGYQSPEQARGRRNLTIHSDVFSLGVTLYEVAAKRHPFNRAQHLIGQHVPAPLNSARNDIPHAFARLVAQMMAYLPGHRPRRISDRFRQLVEP